MNQEQRKRMDEIRKGLDDVENLFSALVGTEQFTSLVGKLDDLGSEIESIKGEEEEKFGNLPESLQQAERGQQMEAAAEALDGAFELVQELLSTLNEFESECEGKLGEVREKLDEADQQ